MATPPVFADSAGISSNVVPAPGLFQPKPSDPHAPSGQTLYVEIDLRIEDKVQQTAIFIPDGFTKGDQIDVVLFLHGFQQNDDVSIARYLQEDYGKLREGVNASGRNVILVAPTLGKKSEADALVQSGGLDDFLARSLSALRAHGGSGWPDTVSLRSLIIACHSGGGVPGRQIAGLRDRALVGLKECWGFESLYHPPDLTFWPAWAHDHPDRRLLIFFRPHASEPDNKKMFQRCRDLRDLHRPNIIVTESNAQEHMFVPLTHWLSCLRGAPFLDPVPEAIV